MPHNHTVHRFCSIWLMPTQIFSHRWRQWRGWGGELWRGELTEAKMIWNIDGDARRCHLNEYFHRIHIALFHLLTIFIRYSSPSPSPNCLQRSSYHGRNHFQLLILLLWHVDSDGFAYISPKAIQTTISKRADSRYRRVKLNMMMWICESFVKHLMANMKHLPQIATGDAVECSEIRNFRLFSRHIWAIRCNRFRCRIFNWKHRINSMLNTSMQAPLNVDAIFHQKMSLSFSF